MRPTTPSLAWPATSTAATWAASYRVGEALEYGMVGINVGILATEHVPFGGVKQSGLGREGSHHGMDDYVEIKYLCIGDIQSGNCCQFWCTISETTS
jgi:acyl-CoA reductase-like NAD-dependent aldehyde dehydrogenase